MNVNNSKFYILGISLGVYIFLAYGSVSFQRKTLFCDISIRKFCEKIELDFTGYPNSFERDKIDGEFILSLKW